MVIPGIGEVYAYKTAYRMWGVVTQKGVPSFKACANGVSFWQSLPEAACHLSCRPNKTFLTCDCGRCGYHSLKSINTYPMGFARGMEEHSFLRAVDAEVAIWGLIHEHELGYRSQFVWPIKIWKSRNLSWDYPDDVYTQLASIYQCELVEPPSVDNYIHEHAYVSY